MPTSVRKAREGQLSDNPMLKRIRKQGKTGHGRKAEKNLAKRMGAKLQPGSGNMEGAKGDMVIPEFLIECKATAFPSMYLRLEWLDKIVKEALEKNREPALAIQYVSSHNGEPVRNGSWVAIPERLFAELFCGKIVIGK